MRYDRVIRLANHDRADQALEQLAARGPSQAGDGRFLFCSGAAGTGKSTYVRRTAEERRAPLIVMRPTSTARSMLADLARSVVGCYVAERGVDGLFLRCVDELRDRHFPFILVDEGDVLDQMPRFVLLHTLRAIADRSGAAILIFSTAALMRRFRVPTPYLEQISSRSAGEVEFNRPTLADAVKLAELIEGVELERNVVRACHGAASGSIRQLLHLYEDIENIARAAGIDGLLSIERAAKLGLVIGREKPSTANPQAESVKEARVA